MRLAYLGPAGTYTEEAALSFDSDAELLPYPSFHAAAAAVEAGDADSAVVAIENSLEGAVTATLDMLIHDSKLYIQNELVLPIHHCLLTKADTHFDDIQVIYSHPQSLGQCRGYLERRLPKAQLVASLSNSAAVQEMQQNGGPAAAIAGRRAAEIYGAEILEESFEDNQSNATRFVVLSPSDHAPTGTDKTSICFAFSHDAPGILQSILSEIARRGINLSKIESRPTKEVLGRYVFLVDIEGHRQDPIVAEMLDSLKAQVSMFRMLGSYPREVSSSVP